jgi:multiple sugar transport system substrate-binding protein
VKFIHHIAAVLGAGCLFSGAVMANPVEIEVWHTLRATHKSEFEKLAKQFNGDQREVVVVLKAFPDQAALRSEEARAAFAKKKPALVQIEDNRSPEIIAQHKDIVPLHQLLKQYPIKDSKWFLNQTTGFMRDAKGQLTAFPFMAEIPVMFYNVDGYKRAGLNPAQPAKTWPVLQDHLLALRDKANYHCPFAISYQVNTHLENLAPINGSLYVTPTNGLDNARAPQLNLSDAVFMRHIAIMVSWKRSELLAHVITTTSGALAQMQNTRGLSFGVAPMPFYDQVTPKAGSPFVSGSALWAIAGQSKEHNKATMAFLAFLSEPVIATAWHQRTGFLPLTDAAFRSSEGGFYDRIPGAKQVVDSMREVNDKNSRGFRLRNYPRIEPILSGELEAALSGKTPPVAALTMAQEQSVHISNEGLSTAKPAAPVRR